eukprot:CAMPEP_0118857460 /NCGR_PEP_ID=MMETSP1163-20130328/4552_1 /TAXON_ID=124430 /ORGANISM="Phaeomonas parva, Strain CCMP2877" /LENGTH=208 /DNA_ID=CAMNT_0006790773 /DNA_START=468 /DNA_END=1094 /DNA_ORIENTATION=-
MFRTLAALALVASASAFAPKAFKATRGRQAMRMGFESEIGAQPPLGFWDPLGLLKDADQDRFDRLRYVEVKHGRISMLAILGHLVTTAGARLPFNYDLSGDSFADVPTGIAAFSKLPLSGTLQIVFFIGALELGFLQVQDEIEDDCEARMDSQGWGAAKKDSKRAIELNNGRAAQMGILAMMVHEQLNNDPYVINTLVGAPIDFNAGF